MFRCIKVKGYLALFEIQESDKKYTLTKTLARRIVEKNAETKIPLVVSHIDFRVDLTIGYITDLVVDSKGLYCSGIIDNQAFVEVQNQLNEDFIKFFTKAEPTPFLYLKSCLSCFSLAHDKNSLNIKHVALVDLGARRGTLIKYSYEENIASKQYSNSKSDFYIVLGCYSRNALKLGKERNELLFKDALICGETNTDFICAGKEPDKKDIKTNMSSVSNTDSRYLNMEQNGLTDALHLISTLASALNQQKGTKRHITSDDEPVSKRIRVDEEPVVNAAQTLVNTEPRQYSAKDDMAEFKNQMKQMQTEFLAAQSNMWRDVLNQNRVMQQMPYFSQSSTLPYQQVNGRNDSMPPMFYQPQAAIHNLPFGWQTQLQNQMPQQIPNQQCMPQVTPSQHNVSSVQQRKPEELANSQQEGNPSVPSNDISQTPTEPQTKQESKTAETALIEAGMDINESEHLINELFRQFIEKNFTVKSK